MSKEKHRMSEDAEKQPSQDADTPVNPRVQGVELPSIPAISIARPGDPLVPVKVGLYSKPGTTQSHNQDTAKTQTVGETSQNYPTRELPPGAPLSSLVQTRQGEVVNPDVDPTLPEDPAQSNLGQSEEAVVKQLSPGTTLLNRPAEEPLKEE